jgi:hypothetical protein
VWMFECSATMPVSHLNSVGPRPRSTPAGDSRSSLFWTFLADMGHSSTKRTWRGILKAAILLRQNFTTSSAVSGLPGTVCTKAATASPWVGCGAATTCENMIDGCSARQRSTSRGETFSPPTFSTSFERPRKTRWPAESK